MRFLDAFSTSGDGWKTPRIVAGCSLGKVFVGFGSFRLKIGHNPTKKQSFEASGFVGPVRGLQISVELQNARSASLDIGAQLRAL